MIEFETQGNFSRTQRFLEKAKQAEFYRILDAHGRAGVAALAAATPVDSGKTASSWDYKIERTSNSAKITWTNSNTNQGVNIAAIIQYGHGTGTGGYVVGIDYINPAMRPIFKKAAEDLFKAVKNL